MTAGQSLVGRHHARPIEWEVLLLEAINCALLFPPIYLSRSPPPTRLQFKQISNNLAGKVPEETQSEPTVNSADYHRPREISTSLFTLVHAFFRLLSSVRALNNVPIPLLPFIIELDHEVGEVWDHGPSEPTRPSRKVDQLFVLRPFRLRR